MFLRFGALFLNLVIAGMSIPGSQAKPFKLKSMHRSACTDLLQALGFALNLNWLGRNNLPAPGVHDMTCSVQGSLIQIGDIASGIWVTSFALFESIFSIIKPLVLGHNDRNPCAYKQHWPSLSIDLSYMHQTAAVLAFRMNVPKGLLTFGICFIWVAVLLMSSVIPMMLAGKSGVPFCKVFAHSPTRNRNKFSIHRRKCRVLVLDLSPLRE